jgi:uncharacterized membrane protein
MNLLHTPVVLEAALLGWLLLAPAALWSLLAVRTRFLPEPGQQHAWLAGAVSIAFLWSLQVEAGDGLHLGMLGSALYALVFGRARAILGLLLALALFTWLDHGAWPNFGVNGLLLAVLPALLATALQNLIERRLPHNLFVFIIGNGMFVTLAVTAATGVLLLALSLATVAPAAASHFADYAGSSLLLAWGEALLSGMLFSALVIFRPQLVLTYREDTYLPPRGRR